MTWVNANHRLIQLSYSFIFQLIIEAFATLSDNLYFRVLPAVPCFLVATLQLVSEMLVLSCLFGEKQSTFNSYYIATQL